MKQVKLKKIPDNGEFTISLQRGSIIYVMQTKRHKTGNRGYEAVCTSKRSGKTFSWPLDKLVYPI